MPSPTSTTVPTLRVSAVASKLSMLPLMMLMISSDRMAIRCSVRVRGSASSSDEAVAEARKPSSHAGIDESVADADGQAPDQLLSLIHISEPTRLGMISYAVFCL